MCEMDARTSVLLFWLGHDDELSLCHAHAVEVCEIGLEAQQQR